MEPAMGLTSPISIWSIQGGRACPNGPATTQANFANGIPQALSDAATGVSLIENVNERPWEPVAPNVKPYRQHEFVVGVDYQIGPAWAFEARYDRRRLDHAIEDASLSDMAWGETYTIVNPGENVNSTIDGYANYLTSLGQSFGVPGWAFNDRLTTVKEPHSVPAPHALPTPRLSATTTALNSGYPKP